MLLGFPRKYANDYVKDIEQTPYAWIANHRNTI